MLRLTSETLATVPGDIVRPAYQRAAIQTGIVHLGIGAFHRAHQAVMTEAAIAAGDTRWGIVGASLRSPAVRDTLRPQDYLYSVASRDGASERIQVIGAIRDVLVAPERPATLIEALAATSTKIISLTVTEKGYCLSPATAQLADDSADVRHDVVNLHAPKTAIGFIIAALRKRRREGIDLPTILSCDNLMSNGRVLKGALVQFAQHVDTDFARYLEGELSCPSTMVDRIVPAATDEDREQIANRLGLTDAGAIITEPFCQWVIEDEFPTGRPEWERGGAELVADVAPYEIMKLRLLNASHSAIAYLGALAGDATFVEAMADDEIRNFVYGLMDLEVSPILTLPPSFDLADYKRALIARFDNPALKHRTHQIAMDGSQKLPPRILASIHERLARGLSIDRLALVVAAWSKYLCGHDETGRHYEISDPLRAELAQHRRNLSELLSITAVFGHDLPKEGRFVRAVEDARRGIDTRGVRATVADCNRRPPNTGL